MVLKHPMDVLYLAIICDYFHAYGSLSHCDRRANPQQTSAVGVEEMVHVVILGYACPTIKLSLYRNLYVD